MPLPPLPLPPGVTSRYIPTRDLTFHILESGHSTTPKPLIILLHGFPEIAYSWRRVLPKLAAAGYHVVAPDQRGFGRTTGWDDRAYSEVDLSTFSLSSLVRDVVLLVHALGYRSVACVAGHDCGAVSAAMCALMRPDFFQSVALMSHPFNGSPDLPLGTGTGDVEGGMEGSAGDVHGKLALLGRKHYKWYYSTAEAGPEMSNLSPEEMRVFLRGYFHLKSGSWEGNRPRALGKWDAEDLVQLPGYYIMPVGETMPGTVALDMAREPTRGNLQRGGCRTRSLTFTLVSMDGRGSRGVELVSGAYGGWGKYTRDFEVFAGKKLEPPCAFVSGKLDWGNYQEPGAIEKMRDGVSCADLRILRMVDGVGHWTPQESPDEVTRAILDLIGGVRDRAV
ncbi:hypothetical protein N7541_006570 [Penicillium brevicompactum]|uniref:AB hydrolase-1 domain-containing protein n=1 Tax=Penicillium brevicompactum TaxID=5074 RepID=A0A9W9R5P0_PENBR|nr:hypothetical protein N7541_006570 [Penicillium brevicompactum]